MNIKVYVTTKVKNKHQLAAIKEYDKRLSRYCKISMVEVKNINDHNIPAKSYKILIDETSQSISSEDLADKLNHLAVTGKSDLAFILFDTEEFDEKLALTSMTMSLGMTLTVLYEQVYRAFRIMKNEPYHK